MIVYVYSGKGTSSISASYSTFSFSMALQNFGFTVRPISAEQILKTNILLQPEARMFVMAGGGFTQVKHALGEKGLDTIRRFVESGGLYCGICMGSYAAFNKIEFQGQQSASNTGLKFFNQTAYGSLPIISPFDGTAASASIIEVDHIPSSVRFPALYWGGNSIKLEDITCNPIIPLATITLPNGTKEIISAKTKVGAGLCYISGFHFEAHSPRHIWDWISKFSQNSMDLWRLENQIYQHPTYAYLMGLATALNDMEIVPHHDFVQQIILRAQDNITEKEKPATKLQASPYIS